MAVHEQESIGGLVKSVLADTRELMREEFELMRLEIRQEMARARTAGIAFGSAAVAGLLAEAGRTGTAASNSHPPPGPRRYTEITASGPGVTVVTP